MASAPLISDNTYYLIGHNDNLAGVKFFLDAKPNLSLQYLTDLL
jgi:hypothetical protein